jgi:DNA-binding beta-propeller fold protein YncE
MLILAASLVVTIAAVVWWITWKSQRGREALSSPPPAPMGRLFAAATGEGGRIHWIELGKSIGSLAMRPDGSEVYVAHPTEAAVTVISTARLLVTHTLRLDGNPNRIVISGDGGKVYVGGALGNVSVIDTQTKAVRTLPTVGPIYDLALTPDGSKLYLAMEYSGLKRMLTASGEVTNIPGQVCPMFLAMDPRGQSLYVSYQCGGPGGRPGHDAVGVLNVATDTIVGSASGPPNVGASIAVSPDGAYVWVDGKDACASWRYNHQGCPIVPGAVVNVLRTSDRAFIQTLGFPAPADVGGPVIFFPDGSRVFWGSVVIDAASFTPVETLDSPAGWVVFTPDRRRAYMAWRKAIGVLELLPATCEPPRSGLANFWPADGNAQDIRDGQPGTLHNGATFAPGRVGRAFSLDGRDDFIDFGIRDEANLSYIDGTFSMWVKLAEGPRREATIAFRGAAKTPQGWRLLVDATGRFGFRLSQTSATGKTVAVPGSWYHLAAVKTGAEISLYVNGVLEASAPLPALPMWQNLRLLIGASAGPRAFFPGLVDEVTIYKRALSAPEIASLVSVCARTGAGQ